MSDITLKTPTVSLGSIFCEIAEGKGFEAAVRLHLVPAFPLDFYRNGSIGVVDKAARDLSACPGQPAFEAGFRWWEARFGLP